jgi:hypothetical protein
MEEMVCYRCEFEGSIFSLTSSALCLYLLVDIRWPTFLHCVFDHHVSALLQDPTTEPAECALKPLTP